jgi:hypothetical protein
MLARSLEKNESTARDARGRPRAATLVTVTIAAPLRANLRETGASNRINWESMESYQVEFRESDGILIVETSGDRDPVESVFFARERALWVRMAEECRARSIHRVLYVSALTGRASTTVTHTIVAELNSIGWSPAIQIALVREDPHAARVVCFGVQLATERGFWAKAFSSRATAMEWLHSEGKVLSCISASAPDCSGCSGPPG